MPEDDGAVKTKHDQKQRLREGDLVERDIDGIWFPAKIIGVREFGNRAQSSGHQAAGDLSYDVIYLDDNNEEWEVPGENIRLQSGAPAKASLGRTMGARADESPEGGRKDKDQWSRRDDDLFRHTDCEPKVTIHSSKATFDANEDGSATAYIINGPETNVAAGSGLRGIRWLRG